MIETLRGNGAYKPYAGHFLSTLLRLTPWYEDETDAVSRELKSLGLFFPHGGAYNPCPWRTVEANLCLAWLLRHWPDLPVRELLVKLFNLKCVNAFHFYPATWNDTVRRHAGETMNAPNLYHPIEPFYTLEAGGHRGQPALYKPTAMWNDWLYEALAEASDSDIMVLNLDALEGYEEALSGAERHFLIYNPAKEEKEFGLVFKHLPPGRYDLSIKMDCDEPIRKTFEASHETGSVRLTLSAGGQCEMTLRHENAAAMLAAIGEQRQARNRICHAYQLLQDKAWMSGESIGFEKHKTRFATAVMDL